MNCMSIENDEQRVLIDCGIGFPDHPFGTDVIRPDFQHLRDTPCDDTALWVTHGHEDHIGAIPYLLRQQPMRIYGPPYALALIRERFQEVPPPRTPELITIEPGRRYPIGPFEAEPIRVTHSIADATALCLRTPVGNIIHTGDFKIDPTPTDGQMFDTERFRALGDAGVRLLLSDSTNVDVEGFTGSEAPVGEALADLVSAASGRVVVTLFASNTHRLRAMIDIARRTRRKLCWLGRSVQTHSRVAVGTGYLDRAEDVLVTPEQAAKLPRIRVLIAATGSQAEPKSALARLSRRDHQYLALDAGDTVILSSRVIPGNERGVIEVLDALERQGVEVIERRTHREVHVSGHAQRGEQEEMLALVRPDSFIPVHGTFHHLTKHAALAREMGVQDTLVAENGDVVEITRDRVRIVDRAVTGRVHVSRGQDVPSEVLDDRKRLAEVGTVAVSFTLDETGRLLAPPDFQARGVLFQGSLRDVLDQARIAAKRGLREAIQDGRLQDLDGLREHVRRVLTRFFFQAMRERVVCIVLVSVVKP